MRSTRMRWGDVLWHHGGVDGDDDFDGEFLARRGVEVDFADVCVERC